MGAEILWGRGMTRGSISTAKANIRSIAAKIGNLRIVFTQILDSVFSPSASMAPVGPNYDMNSKIEEERGGIL